MENEKNDSIPEIISLEEVDEILKNLDKDKKVDNKKEVNTEINNIADKNKKTDKSVTSPASNKKKKKKLFKVLYYVAMFILIGVFVGCSIYLISYYWQAKKIDKQVDELKDLFVEENDDIDYEVVEEEIIVNDEVKKTEFVYINGVKVQKKFAKIYEENNDFVGWLKIDGTKIDYPVMQTLSDEEYYLHRDFDKKYNGNGTLFVDTDSDIGKPSDNILIYGHNMNNGNMFHDILNYEKQDYYSAHKYIEFDTIYGDGRYEVIASFREEIHDVDYDGFKYYNFFDANADYEFTNYVIETQQRTPYTIMESASYGDKLITLSTCAYHSKDGRYVVVAKKIE